MASRTVPDITTLRAICHRDKLERDRRPWYAAVRRISIYITWLLLHTGITANQVTLLTVAVCCTGVVLIAMPPAWVALSGASALLAYHLLDKVDGDIARFRRTFSIVGVYLDEAGHGVAFGGIFLGLGLHLAWGATTVDQAILVLATAGIGGVSMVLARLHKGAGFFLFAQYVLVQPALLPDRDPVASPHPLSREGAHRSRRGEATAGGPGVRILIALRDWVLLLADFVVVLLLVIVGLAIQLVSGDVTWLQIVLVVEAVVQATVLLALVWINYSFNIEAECLRLEALTRGRDRKSGD